MTRTVKCYFCKKDLKKEDAYTWVYISKTNKEYKRYCCSLEEKERIEREKELYSCIQHISDEILGHPIVNNARNKKIKELQEAGYTNEQIFRCFKEYKDEIIKYLQLSGIDKEYNKIAYMFTIIGNKIEDFSKEDERANQWEQYVSETSEEEFIEEEEDIASRLKNKKENKNNIASFLDSLK